MNCLTSLCRRHTASRRPDVFFRHAAPAVRRPPAAIALIGHPIRGLFFQHINNPCPPALRHYYCTFPPRPVITHRYCSRWWKVAALATAVPLLGIGGAVIPGYYGYFETVPCTNRTHFLLCSPEEERRHSESRFAYFKEKNASFMLHPHHPDSVRVSYITSKLVRAVHSHLIIKTHHTVNMLDDRGGNAAVDVLRRKPGNDAWRRSAQPSTGHLNGLNWEVVVVKDKRVNMWSYPAGKIIVTTGFLKDFKTDAEVATMIAHEVGHVVARHWAEKIIYRKCLPRPLRVPFFRRAEKEADQIGMMILAAAGFDPRKAPPAFEKLQHSRRFLSTYPLNKKRSQLLSRSKIMEEALKLYREASPDQDIEGSL